MKLKVCLNKKAYIKLYLLISIIIIIISPPLTEFHLSCIHYTSTTRHEWNAVVQSVKGQTRDGRVASLSSTPVESLWCVLEEDTLSAP